MTAHATSISAALISGATPILTLAHRVNPRLLVSTMWSAYHKLPQLYDHADGSDGVPSFNKNAVLLAFVYRLLEDGLIHADRPVILADVDSLLGKQDLTALSSAGGACRILVGDRDYAGTARWPIVAELVRCLECSQGFVGWGYDDLALYASFVACGGALEYVDSRDSLVVKHGDRQRSRDGDLTLTATRMRNAELFRERYWSFDEAPLSIVPLITHITKDYP